MKSPLRHIVLASMLVMCCEALAEAIAPQLVITAFIEALHGNDSEKVETYADLDKIRSQTRHGYTIETLKHLFADVSVQNIELSRPVYNEERKIISVRMQKPLSFDFELQHQNATGRSGDFYRIIGIHP